MFYNMIGVLEGKGARCDILPIKVQDMLALRPCAYLMKFYKYQKKRCINIEKLPEQIIFYVTES